MNEQKANDSLLSPFRALDLTDEKGFLCGRVLGDLGADVIKVEKPGGDPSRNIGPFYRNIPDSEKSLYWFAYNCNKRGITLDIESSDGKKIFKRLVKTADFVIESFPLDYMEKVGLGYPTLSDINPRIIVTSITSFGKTGPYKDYKTSDIVAVALGGMMNMIGDIDRPPVRMSFSQAFLHAGVEAAIGTMVAHYFREVTGEGQYVDVSIHESISLPMINSSYYWDFSKVRLKRQGSYGVGMGGAAKQRRIWRCKDGYVCFVIFGGAMGAPSNRGLVEWMDSEGIASAELKSMDWDTFDLQKATQEQFDRLETPMATFFLKHTKKELFKGALKRKIMFYPVSSVKDILESPQLAGRDFWEEVTHTELDASIVYPGAFAKLSETPLKIRRRAPMIGEHNKEIYERELRLSGEELVILKERGVI